MITSITAIDNNNRKRSLMLKICIFTLSHPIMLIKEYKLKLIRSEQQENLFKGWEKLASDARYRRVVSHIDLGDITYGMCPINHTRTNTQTTLGCQVLSHKETGRLRLRYVTWAAMSSSVLYVLGYIYTWRLVNSLTSLLRHSSSQSASSRELVEPITWQNLWQPDPPHSSASVDQRWRTTCHLLVDAWITWRYFNKYFN